MKKHDYGHCDACGKPLTARYFTFNRLVEQCHYNQEEVDGDLCIEVLREETLATYCSAECAWPAMLAALMEHGIKHTGGGAGPIEACAKCGGVVLMSQPHIAYSVRDETEWRKPWLTEIQVHEATGLADVCVCCDSDVVGDAVSLPEPIDPALPEKLDIPCG